MLLGITEKKIRSGSYWLHGIIVYGAAFLCSVDDTFVYDLIVKGCFWGFFRRKRRRFAFSRIPPPPPWVEVSRAA